MLRGGGVLGGYFGVWARREATGWGAAYTAVHAGDRQRRAARNGVRGGGGARAARDCPPLPDQPARPARRPARGAARCLRVWNRILTWRRFASCWAGGRASVSAATRR